jgi:dihydroorotase
LGGYSKNMDYLLKGGLIVDPATGLEQEGDVLLSNGRVERLGANLPATDSRAIDVAGLLVVPGLIDMHVHLREPGREDKETIWSGTRAAARGGFASVICKANTELVVDDPAVVGFVYSRAIEQGRVNVFPVGAITKGLRGKELTGFGSLADAGVVALSDDGACVSDARIMRSALENASSYGLLIISHAEDMALTGHGSVTEGYTSTLMGLEGIPVESEATMVARDCLLAEYTGGKLHIAHASTLGSLLAIGQAQARGVDVSAETAPHYFSLTEEAVWDYDTSAKMNPPLRSKEDRQAVIRALQDDTLAVIASDHAPHTLVEKDTSFQEAAFGIIGLETTLPLIITNLVNAGHLSLRQALAKVTCNPAKRLGLNGKGSLQEGCDADITVIDPKAEIVVGEFLSKGRNSPFIGKRLKGKAIHLFVGGKMVLCEGRLVDE